MYKYIGFTIKDKLHSFWFVVNFRNIHKSIVQRVQATFGCGRVYYSRRIKENRPGIWSWQTIQLLDTLKVAKRLQPYLIVKVQTCKLFIKALSKWIETTQRLGKRNKGYMTRPREVIDDIFDTALTLNKCTQTTTARARKSKRIEQIKTNILDFYSEKIV